MPLMQLLPLMLLMALMQLGDNAAGFFDAAAATDAADDVDTAGARCS